MSMTRAAPSSSSSDCRLVTADQPAPTHQPAPQAPTHQPAPQAPTPQHGPQAPQPQHGPQALQPPQAPQPQHGPQAPTHPHGPQAPQPPHSAEQGSVATPAEGSLEASISHDSHETHPNSRQESDAGDERKLKRVHTYEHIKHAAHDIAPGVVAKFRAAKDIFHLHTMEATGPTSLLNPTNIRMNVRHNQDAPPDDIWTSKEMELLWRSRDNRKGRNSIVVPAVPQEGPPFLPTRYTPRLSTKSRDIARNLWRMCTTFAYWDMAFWSGWTYTIGSALFVANGVMSWGPKAFGRGFESADTETYGAPLLFFFGAIFFQIGAVTAYLEAVNDGNFHGAAMRKLLHAHEQDNKKLLDDKFRHFFSHLNPAHRHRVEVYRDPRMPVDLEAAHNAKHPRHMSPGPMYTPDKAPASRRGPVDVSGGEPEGSGYMVWRWWPTWHSLRTHHVYEIGYLACAIQLFGVTLYGMTAIIVLPGILTSLNKWQTLGAYWVPQIVAALCFLIASLMFQLETQANWWKPEPKVLGWWIAVWSVIGSVGFEGAACFGVVGAVRDWHWAHYQADLTSLWGSAAYLIGSFLQWYEASNKKPLEEIMNEPGKMQSSQVHPI